MDKAHLKSFPLRVPEEFVNRMEPGNPRDPLLLQVLPQLLESETVPGFSLDPLQEDAATMAKGLLQKFQGRVLLTVTGACAIHCRYCFRRHFPYEDHTPGLEGWGDALTHILQDPTITEVILSGGDPLLVPDAYLKNLLDQLSEIPHIKRVRFHSRLPVVLPERITESLIDLLKSYDFQLVMVIHGNHPKEFNELVKEAFQRFQRGGIPLFNQAVLLKNINDSVSVLKGLFETGFEAGVIPYYLHLLDRVAGAAHFEVPEGEALKLHRQLQAQLPGYLVPKLVREEPASPSKVLIQT